MFQVVKARSEDGSMHDHFLYYDGESVTGTVHVNLKKANQKFEHQGIRIEFIGQIGEFYSNIDGIRKKAHQLLRKEQLRVDTSSHS